MSSIVDLNQKFDNLCWKKNTGLLVINCCEQPEEVLTCVNLFSQMLVDFSHELPLLKPLNRLLQRNPHQPR